MGNHLRRILVFSLLFAACFSFVCGAFYDDEKSLRTSVLNSYEYKIRPASTVTVNVQLSLLNINLLDIPVQQLSVSGWLVLKWTDERLVWNASDYGGINDIYDTESVLWRPEIIVDNSVDNLGVISDTALLIRATSQGEMTWEPPGIYETHCDVDVTYYPFDTQICVVEVTSWAYTIDEVSLAATDDTINLADFEKSGEWDILSTWAERHELIDGSDTHSEVLFYLKLQRKPAYYVMTILLPVLVTSLLCSMVFILPVESGEKVGYSLTVLLTYSVVISLVASYMPPTSKHTSVLSVYNTIILFIGALCVFLTVFVIYCHHQEEDEEPPSWLLTLVRSFLAPVARIRGKRRFTSSASSSAASSDRHGSTPNGSHTGGKSVPLSHLVVGGHDDRSSVHTSSTDVHVVGIANRSPKNTVHPQRGPRIVTSEADDRRQSYRYGDLRRGSSSSPAGRYSWQDISLLIDSACIRIFGLFVFLFTVITVSVLIIGGYTAK